MSHDTANVGSSFDYNEQTQSVRTLRCTYIFIYEFIQVVGAAYVTCHMRTRQQQWEKMHKANTNEVR